MSSVLATNLPPTGNARMSLLGKAKVSQNLLESLPLFRRLHDSQSNFYHGKRSRISRIFGEPLPACHLWANQLKCRSKRTENLQAKLLRGLRHGAVIGPCFVHGNAGRPVPNRLPRETKDRIIEFIHGKYQDFPTLLLAQ